MEKTRPYRHGIRPGFKCQFCSSLNDDYSVMYMLENMKPGEHIRLCVRCNYPNRFYKPEEIIPTPHRE